MAVSSVSNLDSLTASQTNQSTLGSDAVNRDDFLRLLVAQLKYQDPLNPVENQEFISELATFSSLEQQTNQTKLLQQLVDNNQSNSTSQALSLIGHEVLAQTSRFYFKPGEEQEFVFNADKAGNTVVEISTDSGKVVFSDVLSVTAAGQCTYKFNGKDAGGNSLPERIYNITIGATTDSEGNQTSYTPLLHGKVDAVTFVDGAPVLSINGQPVALSSIQSIY